MREIKYQIFDATPQGIGGQRMYTWEEYCTELAFDFPLDAILSGEVSNLIPLQFTGLLDNNKKEIFEGDIVAFNDMINHVVGFEGGMFCWANIGPSLPIEKKLRVYGGQVIGNVHENPELLGDK